jgi:hypothetical protein
MKLILTSFGPNTFPAHNSALFSCEVQVEYIARTLLAPIIDGRASVIEVRATAEDQWVNGIHGQLKGSVFAAGCSNWYINEFGRNAASWPGYASTFWKETLLPKPGSFNIAAGSKLWPLHTLSRWLRTTNRVTYAILALTLVLRLRGKNVAARTRAHALLLALIRRVRRLE